MIAGEGFRFEIAFATGPDDPAPAWVDVTDRVLLAAGVTITRGRSPEGGAVSPGTCQFKLSNDDGRFTAENAGSPYYPNVTANRRVRVTYVDPVTLAESVRFVGFVGEWPVEWPSGPAIAEVAVAATDRLKRLAGQRPLKSLAEHEIVSDPEVRAYFPMSETGGSTAGDASTAGVSTDLVARQWGSGGAVAFGQGTGAPAAASLPGVLFTPADGSNGLSLEARASTQYEAAPGSGGFSFEFVFSTEAVSSRLVTVFSAGGDYVAVDVDGAGLARIVAQQAGSVLVGTSSAVVVTDNRPRHAWVTMSGFGAAADISLWLDGIRVASCSAWGSVLPDWTVLEVGGRPPYLANASICQVVVNGPSHYEALMTGFAGESSDERIARILGYAGVDVADMALDAGNTRNVEHVDPTGQTALAVCQTVTDTEGGVLFAGRDGRVGLHSRGRRYDAEIACELSADQVRPGLPFTLTDQGLANDVTGKHQTGPSYRATNDPSIEAFGYAPNELNLVTGDDREVVDAVHWQLGERGVPRSRTAAAVVDLTDDAVRDAALELDISSRFKVSGLPGQAPAAEVDLFVEGYTETCSSSGWLLSLNTSNVGASASIWRLDDPQHGALDAGQLLAY